MLAVCKIAGHNNVMTREIDPVRAEAHKSNPNWVTVAKRIAEQPGHENFPVQTVEEIVGQPGQLLLTTLPAREDSFSIGAMIAASQRPFSPSRDQDGRIAGLRINAQRKGLEPGVVMHAAREIAFSIEDGRYSNWMGAGVSDSATTLSANTIQTEFSVGTARVNEFFEILALDERLKDRGDRLVGVLFQTARLALDFGAPTPTAPNALHPGLFEAKLYYKALRERVQALKDARNALATLEEALSNSLAISRPAIHFEGPIDLPDSSAIKEAKRQLLYPPSDNDMRYALNSYDKAIRILDALQAA